MCVSWTTTRAPSTGDVCLGSVQGLRGMHPKFEARLLLLLGMVYPCQLGVTVSARRWRGNDFRESEY